MPGHDNPTDEPGATPKGGPNARRQPAGVPAGPPPGGWFGDLKQLDFEIDFFEAVLARNDRAVEVLRVLAELVAQKGLFRRAVELDRRLVELLPDDFLARYNLACSLARTGRPDEAIDALSRAILLGYDDLSHLEVDPDLDSLRGRPEFRELLGLD